MSAVGLKWREALYPYERFTETARHVLGLAQEEAERARHSYIGTEHLVIALMRAEEGLAARILTAVGVELTAVRETIARVLGASQRVIVQQIIPTSRVRKVIELAFDEGRREGADQIGTDHLLLGLLEEGEGLGAHALRDLGVSIDQVREQARRLAEDGVADPAPSPAGGGEGDPRDHLIGLVDGMTELEAVEALAHLLERLRASGPPPEELLQLAGSVRRAEALKRSAITAGDHEAAARHREEERRLQRVFENALQAWKAS